MKRHLNTLYVTTQGAYLFKDGETLAVKVEETVRLRLPIHTVAGVVCFGQVSVSRPLQKAVSGYSPPQMTAMSIIPQHRPSTTMTTAQ